MPGVDKAQLVADVKAALYASKVCSYAQGMAIIKAKSDEQSWGVDLGGLARIWKVGAHGCLPRTAASAHLLACLLAPAFIACVPANSCRVHCAPPCLHCQWLCKPVLHTSVTPTAALTGQPVSMLAGGASV